MRRTYKFLLRPTCGQADALAAALRDHQQLYNAALEERREAYRKRKVSIRYGDQSAQLKEIRKADPDGQGRWSFSSQQATLRRLDKAFQAFFRRVKAGQTPGFPRFKGAGSFDTVEWPRDRDGCRWDSTPDASQTRAYLQILHAKAESAGRVVVAVNPANTSRRCPECGHTSAENRATQANFQCVACGYTAHADVVGATNVLRAGLALLNA